MNSRIIPLALILSVATGAMAFAATDAVGAIKAIDSAKMTITLADGTVYTLPAGFKLDGLKVGEKVSVMWKMNGAAHEATEIKPVS